MPLSVCRYVRVCVDTCGGQKRVSVPLEIELEVLVSSPMYWFWELNLGHLEEQCILGKH